jgi:hypothetical protein
MPEEDAVAAAVYAHVCGWTVYADNCVELAQAGRHETEDGSNERLA